ncbi:MAG: nicotinate-nucleotide--dimethylbenzimidazole phosphoribosyltransferase, partial [Hyphomonadaceae bacterium]|nr:nicotinate-nucleotide--dimethylbenzimidazole phosphoribosyltransferase [Clostridia bacterium]
VLGMGEMGIGNTTTSAAVIAALSGEAVLEVVGKGAGLTSQAFAHKIHIVEQALLVNQPDPSNALDVLQKLGGFDIAGLVGTCLGAAYFKKPIVLDGFIAGAAALVAIRLNPLVAHYLIASHTSAEPGTAVINRQLGITPPLMLEMRLGEGTGAAMGFFLIDAAMATYTQMGTFDDAKIEQYVPLD